MKDRHRACLVSLIAFLTFVTTIAWVANAITVTNTNDSGSGR